MYAKTCIVFSSFHPHPQGRGFQEDVQIKKLISVYFVTSSNIIYLHKNIGVENVRKSIKVISIALIVGIGIVGIGIGVFFIQKIKTRDVNPFNIEDAPQYIIKARDNIKDKLDNGTFSWADMGTFITFSQYLADNSPTILGLVKGWTDLILFNITGIGDNKDMWFITGNDSLLVEAGQYPFDSYDILILLSFDTFTSILRQDATPLSAFQAGNLDFEGNFDKVLNVAQIAEIASATINDQTIGADTSGPSFNITESILGSYKPGLTIVPSFEIGIVPDRIGEHHQSIIRYGETFIFDHQGKVIASLDAASHSAFKVINSSTIVMGGQGGYLELWNYKTGVIEQLSVPGGHHDFDYNPETDTFMILEYQYTDETWNGQDVIYDKIVEYSRDGQIIWEWKGQTYYPFNETRYIRLGVNHTFRGGIDWMHSNSFVWDKANNHIYLSVRNLNSILKIDYNTKEIMYEAGEFGNFALYDKDGNEKDTHWNFPHGLRMIDENTFLLFDNDLYNRSNPDTMNLSFSQGHSRFVEFTIDEDYKTMNETWSWTPDDPDYYFPESGGNAIRLPGGNTLGIFKNKALVLNIPEPTLLTEVTPTGEIAWEFEIDGENVTYYWSQNIERLYERPIIQINKQTLDLESGTLYVNLSTWNNYLEDVPSDATVKVVTESETIYEYDFTFAKNWQETHLIINITSLPTFDKLSIIVENKDGVEGVFVLYSSPNTGKVGSSNIVVSTASILISLSMVTMVMLRKRKKQKKLIII